MAGARGEVQLQPLFQTSYLRIRLISLGILGNSKHLLHFFSPCRSVSQELSETILTMVANCSNVMNKARQPPPGVMSKGRPPSASSLDAISPVQVTKCYSSCLVFVHSFRIDHKLLRLQQQLEFIILQIAACVVYFKGDPSIGLITEQTLIIKQNITERKDIKPFIQVNEEGFFF